MSKVDITRVICTKELYSFHVRITVDSYGCFKDLLACKFDTKLCMRNTKPDDDLMVYCTIYS